MPQLTSSAGRGSGASPRPSGRPFGPACAACGYPVRGLPTFTCPECGGDLREVGIRTPLGWRIGRRRRVPWAAAVAVPGGGLIKVVVAAAMLAAPAVLIYWGLARLIVYHEERDILRLTNGKDLAYVLTARGRGYRIPTPKESLTVRQIIEGQWVVEVDLATLQATYHDPSGRAWQGTADAQFYQAAVGRGVSQSVAGDLASLTLVAQAGGSVAASGNGNWSAAAGTTADVTTTPGWVKYLAAGLWLPLWFWLARRLFRRPASASGVGGSTDERASALPAAARDVPPAAAAPSQSS